jgi:hypothetical protein
MNHSAIATASYLRPVLLTSCASLEVSTCGHKVLGSSYGSAGTAPALG